MPVQKILAPALVALSLAMSACSSDTAPTGGNTEVQAAQTAAVANYAEIVHASYDDAVIKALDLQAKIGFFITTPSSSTLAQAKQAYMAAREPYEQTETYRFSEGPIDDADGPEGLLNAWPLDELYIDYVQGNATSGIIYDTVNYPTITKEILAELNGKDGEENVSCGYHAIEFLLWGQDMSTTGPGNRSYQDYDYNEFDPIRKMALRRATYLKECAALLVENLKSVRDEWTASGAYRTTFLKLDSKVAFTRMLQGAAQFALGELVAERIVVAYETRLQEDEHSCFSDQTHRDIYLGAQGIVNVVYGKYTRSDGTVLQGKSLLDALKLVDAAKATSLQEKCAAMMGAVNSIRVPFDQEILTDGGRVRVKAAIDAITVVGAEIQTAATALGITLVI